LGGRLAFPTRARRGGTAAADSGLSGLDREERHRHGDPPGGVGCPGLDARRRRARLARLSPVERAELAQRVGEIGVGGDPSLILIVGIILLVAILLYLPMAGRMQGWW